MTVCRDPGPDHGLELGTGEANLGLQAGQCNGNRGIGIRRQGFLGSTTVHSETRLRWQRQRIGPVGTRDEAADRVVDVRQHRLVEIDPTETFHALRYTDQLEPGRRVADERGVEGAPTEVVHRDHVADVDVLVTGVGDGGRLWFGEQHHLVGNESGMIRRGAKLVELELGVVGRMGEHHDAGRFPLLFGGAANDVAELVPHELLDRVRLFADDQRDGVAEAAFELPGAAGRLGSGSSFGGVTDEHLTVVAHDHHGRDRRAIGAELQRVDLIPAPDRCGRIGGAEVDPQRIGTHRRVAVAAGSKLRTLAEVQGVAIDSDDERSDVGLAEVGVAAFDHGLTDDGQRGGVRDDRFPFAGALDGWEIDAADRQLQLVGAGGFECVATGRCPVAGEERLTLLLPLADERGGVELGRGRFGGR